MTHSSLQIHSTIGLAAPARRRLSPRLAHGRPFYILRGLAAVSRNSSETVLCRYMARFPLKIHSTIKANKAHIGEDITKGWRCYPSFDPLVRYRHVVYGFVDVESWVSQPFKQLGLVLYGWPLCRRFASAGRVRDAWLLLRRVELCM
jgi:hypothetical protein